MPMFLIERLKSVKDLVLSKLDTVLLHLNTVLVRQNQIHAELKHLKTLLAKQASQPSPTETAPIETAPVSSVKQFGDDDKERLQFLKSLGFSPNCIYDIGASNGSWSKVISTVFPDASYQLFEPLANIAPAYRELLKENLGTGFKATLHSFALGEKCGSASIYMNSTLFSSSFLVGQETEYFPLSAEVEMFTLDAAIAKFSLPRPQLIKMDTQGYELNILKGAEEALKSVEVILLESWLYRGYGENTPLLFEVAAWLADHNFYLFDISDGFRDESGTLAALDCLFVKQPSSIPAFNTSDRSLSLDKVLQFAKT